MLFHEFCSILFNFWRFFFHVFMLVNQSFPFLIIRELSKFLLNNNYKIVTCLCKLKKKPLYSKSRTRLPKLLKILF